MNAETTAEFSVDVRHTDAGWTVSTGTAGNCSDINTYPTEEQARFAADQIEAGATRYDGAGDVSEH